jgi:NAD(P)-dependent dehydrogenase (short-subunit alcohol dehydrogenase family)
MGKRKIVVTGGFGVLGSAVAARFCESGDQVARIDFAPTPRTALDGVVDLGGVDLTDADAALRAVDSVIAALGGITVLVNVAGGFTWETLADGSVASWRRMFDMNVVTAAAMSRAALPALIAAQTGRIVNIGAGAAIRAETGMGAYAASKAGVHRLTEALAAEVAGAGITENSILPSIIDTPANRAEMPDADTNNWVSPAAIADIVHFLASPAAHAITGALIPATRGG